MAEIIRLAALYARSVTRGAEGYLLSDLPPLRLPGVEIDFITKRPFYLIALTVAVLTIAANWAVERSKLGAYFQAIREDQDAARGIGIDTTVAKLLAFGLSATLGGFAGVIFAAFQRFDYDFVCAILIAIISLIMIGEILATAVRAIFIGNASLADLFRRGTLSGVRHAEDD